MSEANKAVFLSYASQDAEAATRICDALRAAGVEVWFDQSELVGGDQWDAKIRRQIGECALFLPVISASTQARLEGYFRIEWKLAAQRTHAMADEKTFLLPLVIDDTRDTDAKVPAEFRAVQWTRLSGGVAPAAFCDRVMRLLAGEVAPVSDRRRAGGETSAAGQRPSPREGRSRFSPAWLFVVIPVGVVLLAGGGWVLTRYKDSSARLSASLSAEWPRDPAARRARDLFFAVNARQEDMAAAESILDAELARRPTDPELLTVYAQLNNAWMSRSFDLSNERYAKARVAAEQAFRLAGPNDPEALFALGRFWQFRDADHARAEALLRQAIVLKPDDANIHAALVNAVLARDPVGGLDEARKMAARFPQHSVTQYRVATHLLWGGRIEEGEAVLDRALALNRGSTAVSLKALLAVTVHGDIDGMRRAFAQLPAEFRFDDRAVYTAYVLACVTGDLEAGVRTVDAAPDGWLEDLYYTGPKGLLLGDLLRQQGKRDLARLQFEEARVALEKARAKAPADTRLLRLEAWALWYLDRPAEARADARPLFENIARPYRIRPHNIGWFWDPIPQFLIFGERGRALELIGEAVADPQVRARLRTIWGLDPRMAPWREDTEIMALLAEPKGVPTKSAPASEAAQLAARALALYEKIGFTRDDLAPAEDFARRATEREPDSAAAWGVRAGVQSAWLFRGWDFSEKRRQDTQSLANRALALDPNEPEALLALGHVLRSQGASEQAIAHLRRAAEAHPNHVRLARALGYTLNIAGRDAEARTVLQGIAQRAPRDPLVRYELALTYGNFGPGGVNPVFLNAALEQLDAGNAIQPFASALVLKATLLGGWRGDLPAMRTTLDQLDKLPLAERAEDRSVFVSMWAALLEHRPDRVEAAAALTARTYFDDDSLPLRPKAWSLALAHRLAGKDSLARRDWQAAEAVMRQRTKEEPDNAHYQIELAMTLAWLEQREEAARLAGQVEPAWREDLTGDFAKRARLLAHYHAAAGDAAKAGFYLRQAIDQSPFTSRRVIALDPWWDKVRGRPEFDQVLKEPAAK